MIVRVCRSEEVYDWRRAGFYVCLCVSKCLYMWINAMMYTYMMGMRQDFVWYVWARAYEIKVKHSCFTFIELYEVV